MRFLTPFFTVLLFTSVHLCNGQTIANTDGATNSVIQVKDKKKKKKKKKYRLPKVDLNNWKVTIPEGSGKGKAISVSPPEILDYGTNELLKPY
ncbi:MAG: polysaccharide lyase family 7 protein, partial [Bacteroidota bacterium]